MKTTITVRYLSGLQEKFEVDLWGGSNLTSRLQAVVEAPALLLQTDTELIVIRQSAVESISVAIPKEVKAKIRLDDVRYAKRLK